MAISNDENEGGGIRKLKVRFDLPDDDDYPSSVKRHCPSVSSTLSSVSIESEESHEPEDDDSSSSSNSSSSNNKNSIVDTIFKVEPKNEDCNGYESPVWSYQGVSVTTSPPNQRMSPSGYDPERIPSSVFARTQPSPLEWSLASNESLFSLHLGNASFSRDLAFAFNGISGELPRLSDFSSMMPMSPRPQQPVQEPSHDDQQGNVALETLFMSSEAQAKTKALDMTPDRSTEAMVPIEEAKNHASISYQSMESDRSFQFPILTSDSGRSDSAVGTRYFPSTIESDKTENQQPHTSLPPSKKPKKSRIGSWCFCCPSSTCF